MATEADKTNTAVIATMFTIGTAAMIGGSAALVGLAKGEIHEQSEASSGYADLDTVSDLKAQQRERLASAKIPISKAESMVLAELKADPTKASPPPVAGASSAAAPSSTGEAEQAPSPEASGAVAEQPPGSSTGSGAAPADPNP